MRRAYSGVKRRARRGAWDDMSARVRGWHVTWHYPPAIGLQSPLRMYRLYSQIPHSYWMLRKHRLSSLFPSTYSTSVKHFRVTLDHNTLYIEQPLAEALGWKPDAATQGIPLNLTGWAPHYFVIAPSGSEAGALRIYLHITLYHYLQLIRPSCSGHHWKCPQSSSTACPSASQRLRCYH